MSTHSMIAMKSDKGYDCIYVHNDGHLESVGKTLREVFNTDELVLELVALGDCSAVAGRTSIDDVVAFHRDRGEDWDDVKTMCFATLAEAIDHFYETYHYVWEDGIWMAFDKRGDEFDW